MIEACFVVPSKEYQEISGKDKEFGIIWLFNARELLKELNFIVMIFMNQKVMSQISE